MDAGRSVISDQKQRVAAAIEAGKRAYTDKKAQSAAAGAVAGAVTGAIEEGVAALTDSDNS
jgi:hypothetical protein